MMKLCLLNREQAYKSLYIKLLYLLKKSEIIKLAAFVLMIVLFGGISPVFSESFEKYSLILDNTLLNKEILVSTLEEITYIPLCEINEALEIKVTQEEDTLLICRQKSFSEELIKTAKAIYDAVGITPKLFRPPYGVPYIRSQEYKDALSQYMTVLWNVDSMDSRVKGINSSEM